ncbi:MAG: 4Fe-4S dicluster domain-containing protein [Candidatus Bathycorpusculaceae bacterium]
MSEKTYSGLPRKEIKWFPTIDHDLCTGCGICVEFCHEHVYEKQGDKALVARPYDCLVSCESCRPRCPVGAISFPSRAELRQMLKALREKYGYGQVSEVKTQ